MKKLIYIIVVFAMAAIAWGCGNDIDHYEGEVAGEAPIYPDYMDVTVPVGIAPLNFSYTGSGDYSSVVTTMAAGDQTLSVKGRDVILNPRKWSKLLEAAGGGEIQVKSSTGLEWKIYVSGDAIDYGLNYRLIAPGYEVYSKMGIYERELATFKEKALIENTQFDGCVNCHAYNHCDPSDLTLHIRGDHGATLIRKDGQMAAYNTKTDSTLGFCVYPYWHPSGDYVAFSTNNTRQGFHVQQDKLIEVFDLASDLQVYDVKNNQIVTAPWLKMDGQWETFPAFSPDGATLYFCKAYAHPIPSEVTFIRYNLYKVSFDAETGCIGDDLEMVIDAESQGKSISFPKPSFDGKWLMYTLSDYGNFSIWHHEADLWMLNLETGETFPLDGVNSDDTESYHNWSSNSRWFVFGSRRDNGLFTRAYICHMSEDGTAGKPFLLPQENPRVYYQKQLRSYNVPEFVTGPVDFPRIKAEKLINSPERVPMGFRWNGK